jgi:hypothetical protein
MRDCASWLSLDWWELRVGHTAKVAELYLEFLLVGQRGRIAVLRRDGLQRVGRQVIHDRDR